MSQVSVRAAEGLKTDLVNTYHETGRRRVPDHGHLVCGRNR